MGRKVRRVRDGESFRSTNEAAQRLMASAIESGEGETAAHLASVGMVGPYEMVSRDEIRDMKLREGRLQAVGVGLAAEANVASGLSLARRQAGYTQTEAAQIVGITPKTLSRYERGESLPGIRALVSLATAYGVSLDRLLGIADEQREQMLDDFEYATPTGREKILEFARGVHTQDPTARKWAEDDSQKRREQSIDRAESELRNHMSFLNELRKQRREGVCAWSDDEISTYIDGLDKLKEGLDELRSRD